MTTISFKKGKSNCLHNGQPMSDRNEDEFE